jgi:transcriptional regulator with XRE-family HTH domain
VQQSPQHLTQREVAAAMGVSIQRVSQIENGQLDRAEYGTLAAYVRALGGRPRLVADFGDKYLVIG